MIKILRGDTMSEPFLRTLGKLAQVPLDPKTAYRVSKIKTAIFKAREETLVLYEALGPKYAEPATDGVGFQRNTQTDGSWVVKSEHKEAFEKEWGEVLMRVVEIPQHALPVSSLTQVQFSALEIEALSSLISGLEDEATPPKLSAV